MHLLEKRRGGMVLELEKRRGVFSFFYTFEVSFSSSLYRFALGGEEREREGFRVQTFSCFLSVSI